MYAALNLLLLLAEAEKQPESPLGGLGGMFVPLIIVMVLFYLVIALPSQRRERKHRETVLNAMKKGDKVLTNFGLIGVVANIKDDEVTIKLEEGKMRVLKSTIAKIYGAEEAAREGAPAQETSIKKT